MIEPKLATSQKKKSPQHLLKKSACKVGPANFPELPLLFRGREECYLWGFFSPFLLRLLLPRFYFCERQSLSKKKTFPVPSKSMKNKIPDQYSWPPISKVKLSLSSQLRLILTSAFYQLLRKREKDMYVDATSSILVGTSGSRSGNERKE